MSRTIAGKIKINSFADLIGGDDNEVSEVDLTELHDFKDHPFKVADDVKMQELAESIRKSGVLVPGVVRASEEGGYEIISGHRRKRACEIAGLTSMPVIIKKYNDDEAVIAMIDSNLQREEILPSEKAFAYKMKLEALKRKAGRPPKDKMCQVDTDSLADNACPINADSLEDNMRQVDTDSSKENLCQDGTDFTKNNTCQNDTNYRADEALAESSADSARTIQRYIRLTELIKPLLDMVDDKRIKFIPAVELSYLKHKQQEILLNIMTEKSVIPTLSQAQQLRKLSMDGEYTKESALAIMVVAPIKERKVIIKQDIISKYFDPDTSEEEIEKTICTLLEEWQKKGGKT